MNQASVTEAQLKRFGRRVKARRNFLGRTQKQVRLAGGPSDKRQQWIENGQLPVPDADTCAKLDAGLNLVPGSASKSLHGDIELVGLESDEPTYTEAEYERRRAFENALDRLGVTDVVIRKHSGGFVLPQHVIDQLIDRLNSQPDPGD
ncbi:helix-turn-helix domain-containing protein [Nocardia wallacei]|uniref:helix-turn-helix domain-containing protein n=1 Tax=Nocardia wallacei TaxID=480035 RepID=UPI0024541B07|nr:helix-turn-helix domain-containing protein [Nocardia wallacei]